MQDLVDNVGGTPELVRDVCSIGYQTPRFDVVPISVHRRQARADCQNVDSNPVGVCERVGTDIKGLCAALQRLKGGRDILCSPNFEREDFETERAGRCLNLAQLQHDKGIADIAHDRQPAKIGHELAQKFQPLARKVSRQVRQAGGVSMCLTMSRLTSPVEEQRAMAASDGTENGEDAQRQ